MQLYR